MHSDGADGSFVIFGDIETQFPAVSLISVSTMCFFDVLTSQNGGTDEIVALEKRFIAAHPGISTADFIQFAGAVGLSNCPGAPAIDFLAGRPNATIPASIGTVPEPQDPVTMILERMADAGFTPQDLIHLLASHSVARADHVDPTIHDVPFDSTPFTFDTQIFLEVLLKGVGVPGTPNNTGEALSPLPTEGEMRLQSDELLARDPRTACEWQSMVNDQQRMVSNFKSAMQKLAVTGQDTRHFIDCTEAVPGQAPPVTKPASFPAGTSHHDLQQACSRPFPVLRVDRK